MSFEHESLGHHALQATGAAVDIKHAVATLAVKVMMMHRGGGREFIPIRLTGHGDARDLAFTFHSINDAIHRAHTERWHDLLSRRVNLIDRERTLLVGEYLSDCRQLFRAAAFGHGKRLRRGQRRTHGRHAPQEVSRHNHGRGSADERRRDHRQ